MFFKNLTIYRFPAPIGHRLINFRHSLDTGTKECALKPVGPQELSSRGFISPTGKELDEDQQLPYWLDDVIWLTVGGEDRLLPQSVLNSLLQKKLADIEKNEGRKPGGRTRKRIKDELVFELLPRTFIQPRRLDGYIDLKAGLLVVNTASRKAADGFVAELRRALGSFPVQPLSAGVSPRAILTGWIAGDPLPDGLALGDEVTLKDPTDNGASARMSGQELTAEEVGKHLEAGKQATRLALYNDDSVSFALDEDLVIRKFKLLDGAIDRLEHAEGDDIEAELDARLTLMTSEVRLLFAKIESALKLVKLEG